MSSYQARCVLLACAFVLPCLSPSSSFAADAVPAPHHPHATDHGPIGVMGDHTHRRGEWMLSYRYARMHMDGNRDGTDRVSTTEVLRSFPVTPTDMNTEMHMFGVMFAPHERITLMAMLPYVRKQMNHRTRTGRQFETRSDGLGDLRLTALVPLWSRGRSGHSGQSETSQPSQLAGGAAAAHHWLHANLGLSVPTGSTDAKDDTPMGFVRLPYPMQLGSGTVDLLPGLTYRGQALGFGFGGQAMGTLRTGRNGNGYRLGHAYDVTGWLSRPLLSWLSASLRLDWQQRFDIEGDDDRLNPALVPTADPNLRGGSRLDVLLGLNFVMPKGPLVGHRLAVEFGLPVYQDLDGPQLETDWRLVAGWQYAF